MKQGRPVSPIGPLRMHMHLTGILARAVASAATNHLCQAGPQGKAPLGKLLGQGDPLGPCEQPSCPATARLLLGRRGGSPGPDAIKGDRSLTSQHLAIVHSCPLCCCSLTGCSRQWLLSGPARHCWGAAASAALTPCQNAACRAAWQCVAPVASMRLRDGYRCLQENGGAQQTGLLTVSKLEFQNTTVERLPWQGAAFSQDAEHMVGLTPEHKMYAWSLHTGKLEKFLEFEGEPLPITPCPELMTREWTRDKCR